MNHYFSGFFHKFIFFLITMSILFLSACQSSAPRQTYEGTAKPNNEVAIFTVPDPYNLLSIDGVKFSRYALSKDAVIELLPGSHQFIIEYQNFWDLGGGEFEKVTSKPIAITFTAQAGISYILKVTEFETLEDAQKFAEKPSVSIIDTTNKQIVSATVKANLYGKGLFTTLFKGENSNPESLSTASPTSTAYTKNTVKNGQAFDMLRYWWENADENQQNEFRQWLKNN